MFSTSSYVYLYSPVMTLLNQSIHLYKVAQVAGHIFLLHLLSSTVPLLHITDQTSRFLDYNPLKSGSFHLILDTIQKYFA